MKRITTLFLLGGIALWLAASALGGESNSLYLVVDLSGGPDAESWPVSWMETPPGSGWTDEYKSTKLLLRRIDPGSFFMGHTTSDAYGYPYAHVYLSRPFYIGVFEVTQKQYSLVTGYNPSEYQGDTRPVECVSYDNIRGPTLGSGWPTNRTVDDGSFLGLLRTKTKLIFDLPTEAQWEYACRAGTLTELNNGSNLEKYDNDSNMAAMGRYYYNGSKHARVGLYPPNAWGLYDMHGNVQEYCLDWFVGYQGAPYHRVPDVLNLTGPDSGTTRVRRGGSWRCKARDCTSDARGATSPGTGSDDGGFRVAFTTDDSDVYTIRYNRNGGEGHDIYQRVPLGEPATLAPCGFTKAHHVFAGWATMPEGPVRYAAGETVSDLQPDENSIVSLYAVWNLIVRFDANGGTGEMENQLLPYGVPIALNTNAFAREHYAFSGWLLSTWIDEDEECNNKIYMDGQIVTAEDILQQSDELIMYAQWTRVEQIVTFDPCGGTCDTENEIFNIGGLYSSLPQASREHYVLDGWYDKYDDLIDATTAVTADDTRTLYAHWTCVEQVVTFDPNGGICDTESLFYTIGEPYAYLPVATRKHYLIFDGWYTSPEGGNLIVETSTASASETRILYAHWTFLKEAEVKAMKDCLIEDEGFTISFSVKRGEMYALEHTQSLESDTTWFMLETIQAEQNGVMAFTASPPESCHNGFYRVVKVVPLPFFGQQLWEEGPCWAEKNLGAEKPWEYGLYFWWGDTIGYRREGDVWVASDGRTKDFLFEWANTATYSLFPEELQSRGWITEERALTSAHDAAQMQWGGGWRMPTLQELSDLQSKCDWTWTSTNGVSGYVVRGRGDFTDASIFLPAAGYGSGNELAHVGKLSFYWSSRPYFNDSRVWSSWGFSFGWDGHDVSHYDRYLGHSIRPVRGAPNSD